MQATYGVAAGVGIAVAAPCWCRCSSVRSYAATVAVMSAIAIYAVFRSLTAGSADVFKAVGRPEVGMWLGVVRHRAAGAGLLFVSTKWGITGVAAGRP